MMDCTENRCTINTWSNEVQHTTLYQESALEASVKFQSDAIILKTNLSVSGLFEIWQARHPTAQWIDAQIWVATDPIWLTFVYCVIRWDSSNQISYKKTISCCFYIRMQANLISISDHHEIGKQHIKSVCHIGFYWKLSWKYHDFIVW